MKIYIEYEKLTEKNKQWLNDSGATWSSGDQFLDYEPRHKYLIFNGSSWLKFTESRYCFSQYTYCNTGDEFCSKVAELLGKEYKVERERHDTPEMEAQFKKLIQSAKDKGLNLVATIDSPGGAIIYPHKTYRVLESLDDVPLDKRIPLREWIPPFGVELVFIDKDCWIKGSLKSISQRLVTIVEEGYIGETNISLDGQWMRIV